uniref:IlGF domain-containing protein n=1 Tax=Panagrellus redivivus TaxID=6233 RepID=A0A7E4VSM4_PANRE
MSTLSTAYRCVTISIASAFVLLCLTVATVQSQSPEGKQCRQAFHCWRTEPIDDDGLPLQLSDPSGPLAVAARSLISHRPNNLNSNSNNIAKRLDIGSGFGAAGRGARCRCKDETCQYFLTTEQRFLACDEF